jgi:hypothetical protein
MVLLFGIVGLHWFSGSMHYSCRVGAPPIAEMGNWVKYSDFTGDSSYSGICTPERNQMIDPTNMLPKPKLCPTDLNHDSICASPIDYKLPLESQTSNSNIQFGAASFDDIFQALLAVF